MKAQQTGLPPAKTTVSFFCRLLIISPIGRKVAIFYSTWRYSGQLYQLKSSKFISEFLFRFGNKQIFITFCGIAEPVN
ncbi:hypothetical protein DHW03_18265 [Pedobacter yonginense]|uniref:Uncharacterized protein n=1 Tax=Pedobacter yonginense TaxID=651869 RepID=A0A317EHV6_9SPHI|nr:hypothetical protein DHW03_18265 [Pedobacter yonginense]